jgi:predicted aspartyl protease
MSGTFSIHHKPVVTLFDSGATHSFISNNCGTRIGLDLCPTKGSYMISTPGGKITSNQMVKSVCYHRILTGPEVGHGARWA